MASDLPQSEVDGARWRKGTDLPHKEVTFPDQVLDPTRAHLLEYRARVEFAGQKGPIGPAVQTFWLPPTPNDPAPFEITTLGVDFYDRTVVQLKLTKPSDDLLEVWWADGAFPADGDKPNAEFPGKAVPGDAGVRRAEDHMILFDSMSLPVPDKVPRTVTIGIQAVNSADGRSAFKTVVHTLPAT
jgi:hypothetical protein